MCFLGCPCRTKLAMENPAFDVDAPAFAFSAVSYSSRMWCRTLRTVFPTVCSRRILRSQSPATAVTRKWVPFGCASTSLFPTERIRLTSCSMFENLARDTTWRRTRSVSRAASREPTTCLAKTVSTVGPDHDLKHCYRPPAKFGHQHVDRTVACGIRCIWWRHGSRSRSVRKSFGRCTVFWAGRRS